MCSCVSALDGAWTSAAAHVVEGIKAGTLLEALDGSLLSLPWQAVAMSHAAVAPLEKIEGCREGGDVGLRGSEVARCRLALRVLRVVKRSPARRRPTGVRRRLVARPAGFDANGQATTNGR